MLIPCTLHLGGGGQWAWEASVEGHTGAPYQTPGVSSLAQRPLRRAWPAAMFDAAQARNEADDDSPLMRPAVQAGPLDHDEVDEEVLRGVLRRGRGDERPLAVVRHGWVGCNSLPLEVAMRSPFIG